MIVNIFGQDLQQKIDEFFRVPSGDFVYFSLEKSDLFCRAAVSCAQRCRTTKYGG